MNLDVSAFLVRRGRLVGWQKKLCIGFHRLREMIGYLVDERRNLLIAKFRVGDGFLSLAILASMSVATSPDPSSGSVEQLYRRLLGGQRTPIVALVLTKSHRTDKQIFISGNPVRVDIGRRVGFDRVQHQTSGRYRFPPNPMCDACSSKVKLSISTDSRASRAIETSVDRRSRTPRPVYRDREVRTSLFA